MVVQLACLVCLSLFPCLSLGLIGGLWSLRLKPIVPPAGALPYGSIPFACAVACLLVCLCEVLGERWFLRFSAVHSTAFSAASRLRPGCGSLWNAIGSYDPAVSVD